MTDKASLRAKISGMVQGVFFRAYVARQAQELGITGYVRNLPDGSVEVCAEGDREQLEKLAGYLKTGPPAARVTGVDSRWSGCSGSYRDFSIRH